MITNKILVNSRDRLDATKGYGSSDSDFTIFISPAIVSARTITVRNLGLAFSWYGVTPYNNTVIVTRSATTATITIPPGNYTPTTFTATLQALLIASSLGAGWTITYSSTTNKLTITSSAGNFTINSGTTALVPLGISSLPTVSSSIYTSTNTINLTGDAMVLLRCPYVNDVYLGGRQSDVLAAAVINAPPFGTVNKESLSFHVHQLEGPTISSLSFKLTDLSGNTLDLNGNAFSFAIQIDSDGNEK